MGWSAKISDTPYMKQNTTEVLLTGFSGIILAVVCSATFYSMGWHDRAEQDQWLHPAPVEVPVEKKTLPVEVPATMLGMDLLPLPTEMELLGTDLLMPEPIQKLQAVKTRPKKRV